MVTPKKERFDKQVIDSAFKRIIESKRENLDIHFVYAGDHYWFTHEKRPKTFVFEGMKKYKIQKVMLTVIWMRRDRLITKEKIMDFCNGKEFERESVNDDLDSFFKDLRFGKDPNHLVGTYFLPQLTEEELELVEQKNEKFMSTFRDAMEADVEKADMVASESKSKFVYARGTRATYIFENSPNEEVSSSCYLQ